jgi:glutathione S-transferase
LRKLYDHPLSGNGHKVRLLLSMLGLSHEHVFTDVPSGRPQNEPAFVALNPLRQIPVLVDGETVVWDSQAILVYLARRYGPQWLPLEPEPAARVVQWLSFAANEIGNSLQPARVYYLLGEQVDIEKAQAKGRRVLDILNAHLTARAWLAAETPTIADLACFPYVGLCREGKLPLDDYSHVVAWIDRMRSLPGYVAMPGLPPAPEGAYVRVCE